MLESHLVEVNELPPGKLCNYIDNKYYQPIKRLLDILTDYMEEWTGEAESTEKVELMSILFYRLKDEVEQLIRNDILIIFPLIRNDNDVLPCKGRKLPMDMIHSKNKKIMYLLDKMRQMANGYIAKPGWTSHFRLLCDELHNLDQQVLQTIYLKENVLLPKVEKLFNQPCGDNLKHE
jgi:iron-sulfur cluster repair protein YtfE (RIC family)